MNSNDAKHTRAFPAIGFAAFCIVALYFVGFGAAINAKSKAMNLCENVSIGTLRAAAEARIAESAGIVKSGLPSENRLIAVDRIGSSWQCEIELADDRVVARTFRKVD